MVEKKVTKKVETAAPKVEAPKAVKVEASKAAVEAVKAEAPKVVEVPKVEKKEAAKTVATPKVEKKEATKKAPTKKATAKKAVVKEAMYIEFSGKSYTQADLMKIAKDVWKFDLKKKVSDLKSVELYVKPEESIVYYVMNETEKGSFYI